LRDTRFPVVRTRPDYATSPHLQFIIWERSGFDQIVDNIRSLTATGR
jgi:hypothetical protein